MALKLMYITNRAEIAEIALSAGVERIFIDLEIIGKADRQGGMDTVQSKHTVADVAAMCNAVPSAELLVRCNPVHDYVEGYGTTEQEIDNIVSAGADIIMLPYFQTVEEVQRFLNAVNGRVRTMLLFETPASAALAEEIVRLSGIDEVFIGLNDMSLGFGMKFMFQLVADGMVARLCDIFRKAGLPYGFGGIAALGKGMLPAERVIAEHYRLGSTCAILSRSFCNTDIITDLAQIRETFHIGLTDIRAFEKLCANHQVSLEENHVQLVRIVKEICDNIERKAQ